MGPAMYSAAAGYVAGRLAGPDRPQAVIIVSAMSGTTGRLREVLQAVSPEAADDVVATMLTTGEPVSTALMAAALSAAGVVSAQRTGFRADGPADRAVLRDVDPGALRDAVQRFGVAIVPGGQAVDRAGDTVMLGRNSSDLSAVAAAARRRPRRPPPSSDPLGHCPLSCCVLVTSPDRPTPGRTPLGCGPGWRGASCLPRGRRRR